MSTDGFIAALYPILLATIKSCSAIVPDSTLVTTSLECLTRLQSDSQLRSFEESETGFKLLDWIQHTESIQKEQKTRDFCVGALERLVEILHRVASGATPSETQPGQSDSDATASSALVTQEENLENGISPTDMPEVTKKGPADRVIWLTCPAGPDRLTNIMKVAKEYKHDSLVFILPSDSCVNWMNHIENKEEFLGACFISRSDVKNAIERNPMEALTEWIRKGHICKEGEKVDQPHPSVPMLIIDDIHLPCIYTQFIMGWVYKVIMTQYKNAHLLVTCDVGAKVSTIYPQILPFVTRRINAPSPGKKVPVEFVEFRRSEIMANIEEALSRIELKKKCTNILIFLPSLQSAKVMMENMGNITCLKSHTPHLIHQSMTPKKIEKLLSDVKEGKHVFLCTNAVSSLPPMKNVAYVINTGFSAIVESDPNSNTKFDSISNLKRKEGLFSESLSCIYHLFSKKRLETLENVQKNYLPIDDAINIAFRASNTDVFSKDIEDILIGSVHPTASELIRNYLNSLRDGLEVFSNIPLSVHSVNLAIDPSLLVPLPIQALLVECKRHNIIETGLNVATFLCTPRSFFQPHANADEPKSFFQRQGSNKIISLRNLLDHTEMLFSKLYSPELRKLCISLKVDYLVVQEMIAIRESLQRYISHMKELTVGKTQESQERLDDEFTLTRCLSRVFPWTLVSLQEDGCFYNILQREDAHIAHLKKYISKSLKHTLVVKTLGKSKHCNTLICPLSSDNLVIEAVEFLDKLTHGNFGGSSGSVRGSGKGEVTNKIIETKVEWEICDWPTVLLYQISFSKKIRHELLNVYNSTMYLSTLDGRLKIKSPVDKKQDVQEYVSKSLNYFREKLAAESHSMLAKQNCLVRLGPGGVIEEATYNSYSSRMWVKYFGPPTDLKRVMDYLNSLCGSRAMLEESHCRFELEKNHQTSEQVGNMETITIKHAQIVPVMLSDIDHFSTLMKGFNRPSNTNEKIASDESCLTQATSRIKLSCTLDLGLAGARVGLISHDIKISWSNGKPTCLFLVKCRDALSTRQKMSLKRALSNTTKLIEFHPKKKLEKANHDLVLVVLGQNTLPESVSETLKRFDHVKSIHRIHAKDLNLDENERIDNLLSKLESHQITTRDKTSTKYIYGQNWIMSFSSKSEKLEPAVAELNQALKEGDSPYLVSKRYSFRVYIEKSLYKQLKTLLNDRSGRLQDRVRTKTCPGSGEGNQIITYFSDSMEILSAMRLVLLKILNGTTVDLKHPHLLSYYRSKEGIEFIKKHSNQYHGPKVVFRPQSQAIVIHGISSPNKVVEAITQKNESILAGLSLITIPIDDAMASFLQRSKGLMLRTLENTVKSAKARVTTVEGKYVLSMLAKEEMKKSILDTLTSYKSRRRPVVCVGELTFRKRMAAAVTKEKQQDHPTYDETNHECGICGVPIQYGNIYKLLRCGHIFDRSCLVLQLEYCAREGQLPCTCGYDGCDSVISFFDVKKILSNYYVQRLADRALSQCEIGAGWPFLSCKTADCNGVLSAKCESSGQICPECTTRYCMNCIQAHPAEVSCEGFAASHKPDAAFEEWKKSSDSRNCPTCGSVIEKNQGCNHMTCVMCLAHICWACMKVFPSSDKVYQHISAEHN